MGEVWAVRNELTNRDFAIKFLLTEFASNDQAFNRFVREAETTGKLQHPSIVDVFDVAQTEDGRPFIVMELLIGEGLDERLRREGTLTPLTIAAYGSQIAMALDLAHRAGIIHRDLSSSNIFLARTAEDSVLVPKILDFGISKNLVQSDGQFQTCHGAVLGNPLYMSPEQACGAEQVDARTDVWSLGVLMYQCLSGMTPFRSRNYNALMVDIMTRPHRPILELVPSLDRDLAAIVEGCLVKDRNQRIASARELAERLAAVARRLARDGAAVGRVPQRRATDRLPPAQQGAFAKSRGGPLLERRPFAGASRLRVASAAGLVGLLVGAASAYAFISSGATEPSRPAAVPSGPDDGASGAEGQPLPAPRAPRNAVARGAAKP